MAARKLQAEIERTIKKVAEGVEIFEGIFDKISTASNATQKEKLESDLKKEIKKLQRYRDQIKTWAASNEIKDKRVLLENRKLIEQQMEKFKAMEKELKTKAFSQAGLNAQNRIDPQEREKEELRIWISDMGDKLSAQIDMLEAEQETLQLAQRKSKKPDSVKAERLAKIDKQIERHKHHQSTLEILLRMMDNGNLKPEEVASVKEDVTYYVESNQDPYFEEDEGIYDDLNLEEAEAYGFGNDGSDDDDAGSYDEPPTPPKEKEVAHAKTQEQETKRKNAKADRDAAEAAPSPVKAKAAAGRAAKEEVKAAPKLAPLPPRPAVTVTAQSGRALAAANAAAAAAAATAAANAAALAATAASSGPAAADPPAALPQRYAAAAAASDAKAGKAESIAAPQPQTPRKGQAADASAAASGVTAASIVAGRGANAQPAAAAAATHGKASTTQASTPAQRSPQQQAQKLAAAATTPAATTTASSAASSTTPGTHPSPASVASSAGASAGASAAATPISLAAAGVIPGQLTAGASKDEAARPTPTVETLDNRLPPSLADLVSSFEATKERSLRSSADDTYALQMLDTSFQSIPDAADSAKPKNYFPRDPYPVPGYYPQSPLLVLDTTPQIFERFDIDTLFFVFYMRPGTYAQYLAARELKRQSWRFHKKYLTWFQRHEEPVAITEEYEEGAYVYFDYEDAWCQRKKGEFRFEYKYLEDEIPS
ncbi:Not1 N-terminal domain, CCR4-Not complex component-domain-containing protein [Entophlyctis helioformis]|nr:Not1 N-terminal domain, CCR4-Not complex component-domain-containing protein [Entophlyctis helioformis]